MSHNSSMAELFTLRNVIVSGYVTIPQINKFFVTMLSRAGWNGVTGRIWPADRSFENPALNE